MEDIRGEPVRGSSPLSADMERSELGSSPAKNLVQETGVISLTVGGSKLREISRSDLMNAQKESFAFNLNTLYRLERTKRPSTSIAVYAELLASAAIQNSSTIDCEVRFLCNSLKMGTHTVTEMLEEFRRMGLVRFIPIKGMGHKRLIELISEGK